MKLPLPILADQVVARPNPVAVVVHQGVLQRQETQRPLDVQDRLQRLLQLPRRRLVQDLAQLDQVRPSLGILLALEVVDLLVRRRILAQVLKATLPVWRARHLPTRGLRRLEVMLHEVLVELLDARVDAPGLAIDHHPDQVRTRRGYVRTGHLAVQHRPQEARVLVAVQQVQGPEPIQRLPLLERIQRDVQRTLPTRAHHPVGRHPTKVHPDVLVGLAVHHQPRRHLHIRVMEGLQFLFPFRAVERQEQCPQHARVIKRLPGVRRGVGRRHPRARLGRGSVLPTRAPRPKATAPGATPLRPSTARGLLGQELARRVSLQRIQLLVAVLVELLEQLPIRLHPARRPPEPPPRSPRSPRRRSVGQL